MDNLTKQICRLLMAMNVEEPMPDDATDEDYTARFIEMEVACRRNIEEMLAQQVTIPEDGPPRPDGVVNS